MVGHEVGLVVHGVGLGVHVEDPVGHAGVPGVGGPGVGQLAAGAVVESRGLHCRDLYRYHSWCSG